MRAFRDRRERAEPGCGGRIDYLCSEIAGLFLPGGRTRSAEQADRDHCDR
jgi:hypothetical protein